MKRFLATFLLVMIAAAGAQAAPIGGANSYTVPVNPPPVGEATHRDILANVYGETVLNPWAATTAQDYSNGSVNAYRVYDYDGATETVHVVTGDQTNIDQIWTDGVATITAQVKQASFGQTFGWNGGGLGTTYNQLLTSDTVIPVNINIDGDFLWGAGSTSTTDRYWSRMIENPEGEVDHLVSYYIEGASSAPGEKVWLLFWETEAYPTWDQSYNDFVVEIRAVVPEPATLCLFGMGALALLRRRRA